MSIATASMPSGAGWRREAGLRREPSMGMHGRTVHADGTVTRPVTHKRTARVGPRPGAWRTPERLRLPHDPGSDRSFDDVGRLTACYQGRNGDRACCTSYCNVKTRNLTSETVTTPAA